MYEFGFAFSDGEGGGKEEDSWYLECLPQLKPLLLLGIWFYGVCMGWICVQLGVEHTLDDCGILHLLNIGTDQKLGYLVRMEDPC